jgi:NADH-quinone oxidoreductase subunit G
MTTNGAIKVTINGREIEAAQGRLLIDVAEEHDFFVPRFCYHPGMDSVAACRMCLVQIEGGKRPLEPACATYVADGMVVNTNSEVAREAQEAVLELLLINHPLDCPICDRGGECPLQDQTMKFGPGKSRYDEEKRHFVKPIPISDLVMLDRERCVLCWRCVRFADEVAGDDFIDLMDRGSLTQINTAPDKPFESHFSGNTIQICPVGALTSSSYRFLSRPWDLHPTSSTCSYCSVGCPISLDQRGGEVLRAQALPNENVNSFWNCDKGRFGHRYVSHPDRLKAPLIRTKTDDKVQFVESPWDEALDVIADAVKKTLRRTGGSSFGFIGGSHATNEDLYAASKFFKEVIQTPNVDFRTFDASFDYSLLSLDGFIGSTVTLNDLDSAKTIFWFGPDPKEELPVLFLRLRGAARKGAKVFVAHPRRTGLSEFATELRFRPGHEDDLIDALSGGDSTAHGVDAGVIADVRNALAEGGAVVCAGQQFVAQPRDLALKGLVDLARKSGAGLLCCPPNANSQGALDMGIWPSGGLDTTGMLKAASSGDLKVLWVMGADLLTDFPDKQLAEAALRSVPFLVVSELFATDTARAAAVVLSARSFAEKEGSFTNLERRIQKVNPSIPAPGIARADWHIFSDMAQRLGHDWGWKSSADIATEIAESVPTHAGFSWERLQQSDVPILRPLKAQQEESDYRHHKAPDAGGAWPLSWELRAIDATRRHGWVWESNGSASNEPSSPRTPARSSDRPLPLSLLLGRALYDGGNMVGRSPELRNVIRGPFVELHSEEARTRGLQHGSQVTVRSNRGQLVVELKVSDDTPPGAAFMNFDVVGARANELIDIDEERTYVEVER